MDATSAVYDRLFEEGVDLFKSNPCNLTKDAITGRVSCRDGIPCCGKCVHLGPEGCTVQALACKLWMCHTMDKMFPELSMKLGALRREALTQNVPLYFRRSKEETLRVLVKANGQA